MKALLIVILGLFILFLVGYILNRNGILTVEMAQNLLDSLLSKFDTWWAENVTNPGS